MTAYKLFFLLICCMCAFLQKTHAVNITDFKIVVPEQFKSRNATSVPDNKIQMILQNQTDYIKKIVSNEKEKRASHPSPSTKKPSDVNPHKEISLDEFNRCQHLQMLFNEKNKSTKPAATTDAYKSLASVITPSPSNFKEVPARPLNYYFVTQPSNPVPATTSAPKNKPETSTEEQYFLTHTPNPKPQIKYIQYEPAILQKVVMDDGKVLLYRYNNPTISYYVPGIYQPKTHSTTPNPPSHSAEYHPYATSAMSKELPSESPTPKEVTATTKIPNYEIDYGASQKPNNSYINAMKFVVPVPYSVNNGLDTLRSYPWYVVNTYPYYTQPMQRSNVPVAMPYLPVYNMIKTLTIPETHKKK